jgi:hypothetical protein
LVGSICISVQPARQRKLGKSPAANEFGELHGTLV